MTIRSTTNEGFQSNRKYYEVPGAPQTGVGRDGQSREHVVTAAAPAGTEARDVDTRNLTSQSTTPANRFNGNVE